MDRRRISAQRIVHRAAVFGMLLAGCWGIATAETELLWSFQANGGLESMITIPDIDGDQGPDVVFEGYGNGPSGVDHVFAIRGRSFGAAEVLWSARPIGGQSSGGGDGENCLRLGPDCNGDEFPDVLLGTAWGGRTAHSLNGRTGTTLWSWDTYVRTPPSPPSSGWVYAMDGLGSDVNGNGVEDVVFGCGSYNDYCYCVDGADGDLVWAYDGTDAFFDVRSCQDINNDAVRDVVACLGDTDVPEQVIALSGSTGARLWSRPVNYALWNIAFINDITGDGIMEVVPSNWGNQLYCLNGANGDVVWHVAAPAQQRVAALDDVDGDGIRDIGAGLNVTSACRAYSGLNGALLWSTATSDWTWAVDRVGDCSNDGINDVAVGDFDGWVYVLDGTSGAVVWSWRNPTGDKVLTIRGIPDISGNGAPDVIAGTQLLYGGTGGDVYALEGNTTPTWIAEGGSPSDFSIGNASPNPFRGTTGWTVQPGSAAEIKVRIVDAGGRLIRTLGAGDRLARGGQRVVWDGTSDRGISVAAGVYRARIFVDDRSVAVHSVVVMR